MIDFYWGLVITILCITYNTLGILLAHRNVWFQNKKKLYNVKTLSHERSKHISWKIMNRYLKFPKTAFPGTTASMEQTSETNYVLLPKFYRISMIVSVLELLYTIVIICYPEILGFTLFTRSIEQPFFIRVAASLLQAICLVYLHLNYLFYTNYKKTGKFVQIQLKRKLQIYIVDVIKTFMYGLTLFYGYLFLTFESIYTEIYAGTFNSPTITFFITAFILVILFVIHLYKTMSIHKYLIDVTLVDDRE